MYSFFNIKSILLFFPIITICQSIVWEKNFGEILYDQGYSIQQTSDNGYIIAGRKGAVTESVENTPSISVNGDVFIIKINENGDFEWEITYAHENPNQYSYAKCIKEDLINGGFIIGGSHILKINNSNPPEIEWQNYDINSEDIVITPEGNYISVGGSSLICQNPNNGFQISKINNQGNLITSECFGDNSTGIEKAYSIDHIDSNNYIVVGNVFSEACNFITPENCGQIPEPSPSSNFGYHGGGDIWVVKIKDNGTSLTHVPMESGTIGKCYGGSNFDQAYDVKCVNGQYAILCGYTESNGDEFYNDFITSEGGGDFWILKIDLSAGDLIWQKSIGQEYKDHAYALDIDNEENIYVTGLSFSNYSGQHETLFSEQNSGDLVVFKLNSSGDIINSPYCFGGSSIDFGLDIQVLENNMCVISGQTNSQVELLPSFIDLEINGDVSQNNGSEDIWVLKIDLTQNFSSINNIFNLKKQLVKRIGILGQENNTSEFYIEIYNDGTHEKKYLLK